MLLPPFVKLSEGGLPVTTQAQLETVVQGSGKDTRPRA